MDPNEALRRLRDAVETTSDDFEHMREALDEAHLQLDALEAWIKGGGSLPAKWNTPNLGIKVRIGALPVSGVFLIRDGVAYTEVSRNRWVRIGEAVREDTTEEKT